MIHPAATDIIELLKQLVNLLQPFAQSHGIVLAFNPGKKISSFIPARPGHTGYDKPDL